MAVAPVTDSTTSLESMRHEQFEQVAVFAPLEISILVVSS